MGGCSGNCGSCGGCARELVMTEDEVRMLQKLGQIPFWPIARKVDSMTPVFLEEQEKTVAEYGILLEVMEKKGLISLDYDQPLQGFDDSAYRGYPIRGSMALTARGQQVLEVLELQGTAGIENDT